MHGATASLMSRTWVRLVLTLPAEAVARLLKVAKDNAMVMILRTLAAYIATTIRVVTNLQKSTGLGNCALVVRTNAQSSTTEFEMPRPVTDVEQILTHWVSHECLSKSGKTLTLLGTISASPWAFGTVG